MIHLRKIDVRPRVVECLTSLYYHDLKCVSRSSEMELVTWTCHCNNVLREKERIILLETFESIIKPSHLIHVAIFSFGIGRIDIKVQNEIFYYKLIEVS